MNHIMEIDRSKLQPQKTVSNALKFSGNMISKLEFFFFFFFWSFQGCTHSIWRFPSQGSNRNCSCWSVLQPQQRQSQAESLT